MAEEPTARLIPHGERAVVEIEKLRDYCLSPSHLRGRHKARVFMARLGLTADHAEWLRGQLLRVVRELPAEVDKKDEFGQRYVIDFELTTETGTAIVRSSWIIHTKGNFPRLTTCFVR